MAQLLYPIGIQSFRKIRNGDYIYIDKTDYIHRLVTNGEYYFLSRPRRFGKSLLISTIEEFFLGNRELFDGLAISRHDHDWEQYPVLHIDLSGRNYKDPDALAAHLNSILEKWEEIYGDEKRNRAPEERFEHVIRKASSLTGRNVVVLVDEYDKPLLDTVGNPSLQDSYRSQLRAFYSNLKSQDSHIRFAMLTGVTKFGHLSIFSDLNNLNDISLDDDSAGICGITKEELHEYFDSGVADLASRHRITMDEAYDLLRKNYDGYHFSPMVYPDIYNPFSVLNCLKKNFVRDYWFSTGTPTFLVRMIKEHSIPIHEIAECEAPLSSLSDVSFDLGNPVPVLYQSGYLTIKGYDPEFDNVTLGFPNREVERGFLNCLIPLYASVQGSSPFKVSDFIKDLRRGDAESFMRRLQSLFADFPYDSFDMKHLEQHYQDVTFILAKLMGFDTHVEYRTAAGRIDLLIKTADYIYVFEFKMDKSPKEAIDQIDGKGYLIPFRADGRKLVKVGASFSKEGRIPDDWIIEYLPQ